MGHLKLSIYFKGKDRNNIIRAASEFMSNFTKACKMELDGYKGTYIGFITSNDYEKKNVKQRYVVNLEFDGFFVDDDLSITFDGKTSASFYKVGTRDAPCVVEVYAKSALTNYTITGLGEDDIIIESLAAGKTVVIDAKTGQEDAEQRATTDTMVMMKLENIADDLKDIKRESRENREEMKSLRDRVVIVEQSLKRLDGEQHSDR